ncbi:MAG: hypothetical protein M3O25_11965 [Actinomycetota bacterium]|nr:hypothetical protein [Actinomycetota bacterium]
MIWVLIAALTLGIVAFFVYLFVVRPRALERYGALEVPGEQTIELPAGEVGVFYQDAARWRFSERARVGPGFSVLISDESGERVDLREPGSETIYKSGGKNRIPYGCVSLPEAGRYRVASQIDSGVEKPLVTFGRAV